MLFRFPAVIAVLALWISNSHSAPLPRELAPYSKLKPDGLTRIERALLPDIAVAVATVEEGSILSCAFSSNGVFAVGTDRGTVVLWDCSQAVPKEIGKLAPENLGAVPKPLPLPKTTDDVFRYRADRLAFTPDGKKLVVSLGGSIHLWEITEKGGKLIDTQKIGRIEGLAVSPDGKNIVCGSNLGKRFILGDAKLEPQEGVFTGAQGEYTFSKNGEYFASVFFTPERNGNLYGSEIMFWKPEKNKTVGHDLVTIDSSIKALALSPDGKTMATGSLDKNVRLWDLGGKKTTTTAMMEAPKWIRKLAYTPDGETLIAFSSGTDIILYDVAKGKQKQAWEFKPRANTDFASPYLFFTATAVAPDGNHIAFSTGNTKAVILRLPEPNEVKK